MPTLFPDDGQSADRGVTGLWRQWGWPDRAGMMSFRSCLLVLCREYRVSRELVSCVCMCVYVYCSLLGRVLGSPVPEVVVLYCTLSTLTKLLCLYSVCTLYPLCTLSVLCTLYPLSVLCTLSVPTLSLLCPYSVPTLSVLSLYSLSLICTHSVLRVLYTVS